jgi:hypothetical protein
MDIAFPNSSDCGFRQPPLSDPSTEIRLLKLYDGESHDDLVADMMVFRTQRAPSYGAISYAWGSSETPRDIWINGSKAWVGENCHFALQQARHFGSTSITGSMRCASISLTFGRKAIRSA